MEAPLKDYSQKKMFWLPSTIHEIFLGLKKYPDRHHICKQICIYIGINADVTLVHGRTTTTECEDRARILKKKNSPYDLCTQIQMHFKVYADLI